MASQSRETQFFEDFSSLREELMDVLRYFCLSPKLRHCDAA